MVELGPWIAYFIIYSFLGWVWETTFVSIRTGRFVNRGFLKGFFIPIYGCGAVLILVVKNLIAQPTGSYTVNILIVVLISILVVTLLEFLTGYTMEIIFHRIWWDYSERGLNIKGYVCLETSLVWGIFIVVFILFLHPNVSFFLLDLSNQSLFSISILLLFYLFLDLILSFIDALSLRETIIKPTEIPLEKNHINIISYQRLINTFPRLQKLIACITNFKVRSIINGNVKKFKTQIGSKFR